MGELHETANMWEERRGARLKSLFVRLLPSNFCAGTCPSIYITYMCNTSTVQCNVVLPPAWNFHNRISLDSNILILLSQESCPYAHALKQSCFIFTPQKKPCFTHGQTPCLDSSSSPLHSWLPQLLLAEFSRFLFTVNKSPSKSKCSSAVAPCWTRSSSSPGAKSLQFAIIPQNKNTLEPQRPPFQSFQLALLGFNKFDRLIPSTTRIRSILQDWLTWDHSNKTLTASDCSYCRWVTSNHVP